jgi:hypothetical protein
MLVPRTAQCRRKPCRRPHRVGCQAADSMRHLFCIPKIKTVYHRIFLELCDTMLHAYEGYIELDGSFADE